MHRDLIYAVCISAVIFLSGCSSEKGESSDSVPKSTGPTYSTAVEETTVTSSVQTDKAESSTKPEISAATVTTPSETAKSTTEQSTDAGEAVIAAEKPEQNTDSTEAFDGPEYPQEQQDEIMIYEEDTSGEVIPESTAESDENEQADENVIELPFVPAKK